MRLRHEACHTVLGVGNRACVSETGAMAQHKQVAHAAPGLVVRLEAWCPARCVGMSDGTDTAGPYASVVANRVGGSATRAPGTLISRASCIQ
jgi:hypothetical protein